MTALAEVHPRGPPVGVRFIWKASPLDHCAALVKVITVLAQVSPAKLLTNCKSLSKGKDPLWLAPKLYLVSSFSRRFLGQFLGFNSLVATGGVQ